MVQDKPSRTIKKSSDPFGFNDEASNVPLRAKQGATKPIVAEAVVPEKPFRVVQNVDASKAVRTSEQVEQHKPATTKSMAVEAFVPEKQSQATTIPARALLKGSGILTSNGKQSDQTAKLESESAPKPSAPDGTAKLGRRSLRTKRPEQMQQVDEIENPVPHTDEDQGQQNSRSSPKLDYSQDLNAVPGKRRKVSVATFPIIIAK